MVRAASGPASTTASDPRLAAMASRLYFAAAQHDRGLSIVVDEEPDQIQGALLSAGGDQPFKLTESATGQALYVNPRTVAYWKRDGDGPLSEAAAAASPWRAPGDRQSPDDSNRGGPATSGGGSGRLGRLGRRPPR
jgi:hypothetical protein